MHKQLLNEAVIEFTLEPTGALLIKSGAEGADPTRPDMEFVRTHHNGVETVYLPGSSLKGVIRSYCEKIARTLEVRCCDPVASDKTKSCGGQLENASPTPELYEKHCYICRLFGSTVLASRCQLFDAYPIKAAKTEKRTNVAIDRILGAVAAGPFDMEVATSGIFKTQLYLKNFELWQLGLIGLVLRDMAQERVRIGFAKSRGLGQVKATVTSVTLLYSGFKCADDGKRMISLNGKKGELPSLEDGKTRVYGVGKLAGEEAVQYGFDAADEAVVEASASFDNDWLKTCLVFNGDSAMQLFKACVEQRWAKLLEK